MTKKKTNAPPPHKKIVVPNLIICIALGKATSFSKKRAYLKKCTHLKKCA